MATKKKWQIRVPTNNERLTVKVARLLRKAGLAVEVDGNTRTSIITPERGIWLV